MGALVRVIERSFDEIRTELEAFEKRYDTASEHLVEAFTNSPLHETDDFHRWSNLYAAYCAVPATER